MARNNRGRSTTGGPAVPHCLSTPAKEAAKFLRLVADRYIKDRASLRDVEEAMVMLRAVAPVAGDVGFREPTPAKRAKVARP